MQKKLNSIKTGVRARHAVTLTAATLAAGVAVPLTAPSAAHADTQMTAQDNAAAVHVAKTRYAYKVPYVYGGSTPSGFDCSGMTRYLYAGRGVSLPHSSAAQYSSVTHISRSAAAPGDLAFYYGSGGIYHVGIYAGDNKIVHAMNPSMDIQVSELQSNVRFGTKRY